MTASRRMYGSFILFGLFFLVFDDGLTEKSWSRGLVYGCGVASLLFFLYAMYVFYFDVTRGDKHLQRSGTQGTAVVLAAKQTRALAQTGQFDFQAPFIWKYTLQVTIPGKEPYQASCSVARDNIAEGSTVNVAVSRFNRRSVTILADRPISAAPGRQPSQGSTDREQLLVQSLQSAHSGQRPQSPAADPGLSHVDALAKLADLHRTGALTDAEFATEKSRIIGD
jgi:hypothetical protein